MKKWISLENLIYTTIFLLPVYLVRFSIFGAPTNLLEILIAIVCVWAFCQKINFKNLYKSSFRFAISLIFIGLFLSTVINKNYAVGFGIIKGWFALPFVLALVARQIIPAEKKQKIYVALYFSGAAVAIISLLYYFTGAMTFDGRLQGIFNSPNYLAMYLAPALIIGAVLAQSIKRLKTKYVLCYITSYVTILAAFYLTYSYAAWGAAAISLLIINGIKSKNKIKLKKSAVVLLLLAVVAISQWNNQKFQDAKNLADRSSLNSRLMIWRSAGKITADNWFWGIGPGNFQDKYLAYQKYFPPYLEWAVPHPHNLYLSFWLQVGFVGLAGFLALIYLWFKAVLKKEKDITWLMSLGIMLYFLIHGLVDTTYFKNDLAVIFWINFLLAL